MANFFVPNLASVSQNLQTAAKALKKTSKLNATQLGAVGGSALGALSQTGIGESEEQRQNTSLTDRIAKVGAGAVIGGGAGAGAAIGAKAIKNSFKPTTPTGAPTPPPVPQHSFDSASNTATIKRKGFDGLEIDEKFDLSKPTDQLSYLNRKLDDLKANGNLTPAQLQEKRSLIKQIGALRQSSGQLSYYRGKTVSFKTYLIRTIRNF